MLRPTVKRAFVTTMQQLRARGKSAFFRYLGPLAAELFRSRSENSHSINLTKVIALGRSAFGLPVTYCRGKTMVSTVEVVPDNAGRCQPLGSVLWRAIQSVKQLEYPSVPEDFTGIIHPALQRDQLLLCSSIGLMILLDKVHSDKMGPDPAVHGTPAAVGERKEQRRCKILKLLACLIDWRLSISQVSWLCCAANPNQRNTYVTPTRFSYLLLPPETPSFRFIGRQVEMGSTLPLLSAKKKTRGDIATYKLLGEP